MQAALKINNIAENSTRSARRAKGGSPIHGTVKDIVCKQYTFHLDEEIGEVPDYQDLTSILLDANEGDEINLIIHGPGGYAYTMAHLVNLIQSTKAHVIGHLTGPAASAHSFLFLACHEWMVYPHAMLMAHCYSGAAWGKGAEIKQHYEADKKLFDYMIDELYFPFFTEEECEGIRRNQDIWLHSKEITERLLRIVDHRDAQALEAKKAALQAMAEDVGELE